MVVAMHLTGFPLFITVLWMGGNIGNYGVEIFIVISGAVLEYTYGEQIKEAGKNFDFKYFIKKRLVRIYPAYWFSLLLSLIIAFGYLAPFTWVDLIASSTGFYTFLAGFGVIVSTYSLGGGINPLGWFIGTIVCLYIMYPFLSGFLRDYNIQALIMLFFVEAFVFMVIPIGMGVSYVYWFPLGRIFEFGLGIFIVQNGYYLKTENKFNLLRFASDLSFPLFLVSFPALIIINKVPSVYDENIIIYLIVIFILALVVYYFDKAVEKLLLRRNHFSEERSNLMEK